MVGRASITSGAAFVKRGGRGERRWEGTSPAPLGRRARLRRDPAPFATDPSCASDVAPAGPTMKGGLGEGDRRASHAGPEGHDQGDRAPPDAAPQARLDRLVHGAAPSVMPQDGAPRRPTPSAPARAEHLHAPRVHAPGLSSSTVFRRRSPSAVTLAPSAGHPVLGGAAGATWDWLSGHLEQVQVDHSVGGAETVASMSPCLAAQRYRAEPPGTSDPDWTSGCAVRRWRWCRCSPRRNGCLDQRGRGCRWCRDDRSGALPSRWSCTWPGQRHGGKRNNGKREGVEHRRSACSERIQAPWRHSREGIAQLL